MALHAVGAVPSTAPSKSASPTPLSLKRLPALDGLRGIAILLVLGHHFRFLLDPSHRLEHISLFVVDGGWCGVELFFVLSGFLITGILLDSKGSKAYFRNFYARRVLRIFPLYYAYLFLVLVVFSAWWRWHFHFNPWKDVNPAWYLLYLENFKPHHMFYDLFLGHLWSLAIEEQFYVIWPFLVLILSRASLGFLCMLATSAALISRLFLAGHSVPTSFFLNTFTVASIDSLCLGALIALVVRNESLRKRIGPWITAATLFCGLCFCALTKSAGTLFLYSVPINTFGLSCLNAVFAGIIYWIAAGKSPLLRRVLSFAPLRAVGTVSYGMYVLHPAVIAFVLPKIHPVAPGTPVRLQFLIKLGVMLLLALCTYLVALLSWQLLEQPFLRLKRSFQYSKHQSSGGLVVMSPPFALSKCQDSANSANAP